MIVSLINLKGGVGKTTSAIALATAACRDGLDVEVVDCDAQSSASLWAMTAEDAGDSLPFEVTAGNLANVRRAGRSWKGDESKWLFVDCPPHGQIVDEAMKAADLVVIPSGTGTADMAKTVETARTLEGAGVFYAIVLTQVVANTLTLAAAVSELAAGQLSYYDDHIRRREGLKAFFGNSFGDDLFGYEKIWGSIKADLLDAGGSGEEEGEEE